MDKIAFTGSTEVGRLIRTATAGSGKKLSLELGGKSPFIVFPDADLDSVVEGVVDAIWFNQGQVCCAGSRILAQEGVAERLVAKLKARMETLRVGDPLDKAVDMGAIIAPVQLEKIQGLVRRGEEEGATLWQPSWSCPREGWFFPPTLFTEVSPAATIAQVEIFGPVVVLMTFRTPAEAVELANNTRYGLAASVWTENINLALDVAPQLKAGTVWINCTNVFDAASGFGGYRESGFGREGGREGLREYVKWAGEKDGGDGGTAQRRKEACSQESRPPRVRIAPLRRRAVAPSFRRSIAPPSSTSAASRRGPIRGTACRCTTPPGARIGEVGHGQPQGHPQRGRGGAKGGGLGSDHRAQPRPGALLPRREPGRAAGRVRAAGSGRPTKWRSPSSGSTPGRPWRTNTMARCTTRRTGTSRSRCPSRSACSASSAPTRPRCSASSRRCCRRLRWATRSSRFRRPAAPLAATDFYQVLDTSDVPGGVINIVTGVRDELSPVLAAHDDVDGMWYFGTAEGSAEVERLSAGNMKRTWVNYGRSRDWADARRGASEEFLEQATQVKNIWVPYGE